LSENEFIAQLTQAKEQIIHAAINKAPVYINADGK